jgi:hypothetical protein
MNDTGNNPTKNNLSATAIIACATVIEEMLPLIPPEMSYQVLDFGLHVNPAGLKMSLQKAIDETAPSIKQIILGYGLCSQAVIGLKSASSTLVIPRVDDCIAIFLGSKTAYRNQNSHEPGTYYLTKGWIKTNSTPFDEFECLAKQYGYAKACRILHQLFKNYTRLAFIDTGLVDLEQYRSKTRELAARFGLKYENIQGSDLLIRKMIFGPWDDDFLIVKPGETLLFDDFIQVGA